MLAEGVLFDEGEWCHVKLVRQGEFVEFGGNRLGSDNIHSPQGKVHILARRMAALRAGTGELDERDFGVSAKHFRD